MIFSQTKIIVHPDFSEIAPKNTLTAFQKAIESGAEYFELDAHKTKDKAIIVIHSASVNRTSSNGMNSKISEMNYTGITTVTEGYTSKFKINSKRKDNNLKRGSRIGQA